MHFDGFFMSMVTKTGDPLDIQSLNSKFCCEQFATLRIFLVSEIYVIKIKEKSKTCSHNLQKILQGESEDKQYINQDWSKNLYTGVSM